MDKDKGPTHFDEEGRARMVDVSKKQPTLRRAVAACTVVMKAETLEMILAKKTSKGDVFQIARIAGIMAAKQTPALIPLCHPVALTAVDVDLKKAGDASVDIRAEVRARDATGVEMEALTAASVAALTVYDMCKAVDRGISVTDLRLLEKSGGKSGTYIR